MSLKIDSLKNLLVGFGRVCVALSGGLDSSVLLAFCAQTLGAKNCTAITAFMPYAMQSECSFAETLCKKLGVKLVKIVENSIPAEITYNPPERCYLCKKNIFGKFKDAAISQNAGVLCDGTNADDLSDYRPGMKALKEIGVKSPFLECEIGKDLIRQIAREILPEVAEKPAYACLLTRLEHGRKIETETLKKIDGFEGYLRRLNIGKVRARTDGNSVRIECSVGDFEKVVKNAAQINKEANDFGFKRCTLDLAGYKTGSMNVKI
ncbi:MAG: ATP-dependent sacrificial sulfur transferase LarE [Opitutales bacterium]|nr:ATP-dependent sacrificial sulfur transferase LarE [Opitutales bacterium]